MNLEHGEIFYNTYEADSLRPYFSFASFMETFDKTVSILLPCIGTSGQT
jgi:uncharacterized membrane protein